jgi:S-(hydroxymethyl)glutathione dehydrogenase/alcohol dehydrogenase
MRGIVWTGSLDITDDLEVIEPGPNEVLVRIVSAGVCHSDLSVIDGTIQFPTPVVLGHEGAGVVEAVGSTVTLVQPGDHVVVITMEYCGACAKCDIGQPTLCLNQTNRIVNHRPFTYKGQRAYAFANAAVWSERTVVRENQAVKIADDISFDSASLLGCGVMTGAGAVFNRAKVERGSTVAVIGVGGIGLNVIQAAAVSGAMTIIAIDALASKEPFAYTFGATHFVSAREVDAVAAVKDLCPRGVDYSFECVGRPNLVRQTIDMLAPGGTCVAIGTNPPDSEVAFLVRDINLDKTIMGCRYGTSKPHRDIPMFVDLYRSGRMKLDELVSRRYPIDEVEAVFADMQSGSIARGVLGIGTA